MESILHSFEAWRRGKPDELESQIANIIVTQLLKKISNGKADIRVIGDWDSKKQTPKLFIYWEISDIVFKDFQWFKECNNAIISYYKKVTKNNLPEDQITWDVKWQSHSLQENSENNKSWDTGTCIGIAYNNTPVYLPWERHLAVWLRDMIDADFINETSEFFDWELLESDGKIEVLAKYKDNNLESIPEISFAIQHKQEYSLSLLREHTKDLVEHYFNKFWLNLELPKIMVNSAWPRHEWWWKVDAWSREAKPHRDGFSSYGHCEDSFSGEDPSKPSKSWTLLARKIACFLVKNDYCCFAKVMLCFRIWMEKPFVHIFTNNTSSYDQETLEFIINNNFDLEIAKWIKEANLTDYETYNKIVNASDYFQSEEFYWNF